MVRYNFKNMYINYKSLTLTVMCAIANFFVLELVLEWIVETNNYKYDLLLFPIKELKFILLEMNNNFKAI